MKPLKSSEIRGNWATLLLPIRPDETIDFKLLGVQIDFFSAARVNGVYSNGSAGEFFSQTEDEFDRIHQLLAEKCERVELPFQIGASHMSPQLSLARVRRAKALKPSAFQIIIPDWFPPTHDEIYRFLDVVSAAADPIPLIIYNPPHAKKRLGPADWLAILSRAPSVVGLKVPGGDRAWYEAMKPVLERISVFIPGHTLATGLSLGAHGAYSNVACLSPGGAQSWYELCRTDLAKGLELEKRIGRLINDNVLPLLTKLHLSNMAADKAMAVAGGWLPGFTPRLRWPYSRADDEEIARIAKVARELVPEFFHST